MVKPQRMAHTKGVAIASALVLMLAVPSAYLAIILLNAHESGNPLELLLSGLR